MKKILVSDYDGTFFLNDKDIEKNKKMVDNFRQKGNIFIIATGRSYLDFYRELSKYKFAYDYVILNHGATIIDSNGKIIANFAIDDEIKNNIKKDLQLNKVVDSFCCSKLESRVNFEHKNLTKINLKYESKTIALAINEILSKKYKKDINAYYVNNNMLEIITPETNKSKAIKYLLNKLNLLEENIYTIGDGYSDIDMIKDFNGYAIANSVEELKKVAIKIYNSVSDLIKDII